MGDYAWPLFGHGFQGRDRPLDRNSFFPWPLLLETKWDFSESPVAQAGELKAKLWQEPVILGSSCGKFYCMAFPSPYPQSPSSLLQTPFPLPCAHSFLATSSSPLTSVWTMPSGALLSSCTTRLSLIPLPKPASGSHLRVLGSKEYVHYHWYPSMGGLQDLPSSILRPLPTDGYPELEQLLLIFQTLRVCRN